MNPFATAVDAIFASDMAEDAVYASPGEAAQPVRIVRRHRGADLGSVRPRSSVISTTVEVRRADIANPVGGASFVAGGHVLMIVGSPEIDVEGLTWLCEAPLLDRTVTLLVWGVADNSYGDPAEGFTAGLTVPAASWQMPGGEAVETDQIQATNRTVFFLPWSAEAAALGARGRLLSDGSVYEIEAVTEVGRQIGIEIVTVKGGD